MIEELRDFDLVDQSFLPVLLRVSGLLPEGLDGDLLLVAETDPQVDSCEVALSQSLLSLEQVVKVVLVHMVFEIYLPLLQLLHVIAKELL